MRYILDNFNFLQALALISVIMAFLRFFWEELIPALDADKGYVIKDRRFLHKATSDKTLEVLLSLGYDFERAKYTWTMKIIQGIKKLYSSY